jgi:parallel beta-helix repeat protein
VTFSTRFAAKRYTRVKIGTAPALLAAMALLFVAQNARTDDNDEHKITGITDCGTLISESGRYFLANDLKNCSGFGISIAVSNVKVALRGHTIQGTSGDNMIVAQGADTGLSDLEIEGPGTVTGGIAGIAFGNVHHSSVHGLTLVRNNFGMTVNSGDFTSDATVAATVSTDNEISDNVVASNTFHGISVNGGDKNRFLRNNLSGNGTHGLFLFTANNNVARENTADMNAGSGIDAGTFGSGNQVANNIALGNEGPDLNDENDDCVRNTWTGNSFNSNSPGCIQ